MILLVENSVRYYSRYLPILYTEIIKQTQRLITRDNLDGVKKILRMRARPKVLLAVSYEEAVELYEKFQNTILCVISDVKFPIEGRIDEDAGIKLLKKIKTTDSDIPFLLQSSESEYSETAILHDATFINKNSETLTDDLRDFILGNLGFGDFIFRDKAGNEIISASSFEEFKRLLKKKFRQNQFYIMAAGIIFLPGLWQEVKFR